MVTSIALTIVAAVCLIAYMLRRRARLRSED